MIKLIEDAIEVTPVPNNSNTDTGNQEIPEHVIQNALETESNAIIQNIWALISNINGLSASLDFDYKDSNKEDIKEILESMVNDLTIDIGMMYKIISIINNKTTELIDDGKQKAEELITSDETEESTDNSAEELNSEESDITSEE